MTDPVHPFKRLLTEGAVLAGIPIIASLVAYLYEFGFLSFYKVPPSFIQLDFTRILTATAVVLLAIVLFLMLLATAADVSSGRHPLVRALGRALVLSLVWLPFFALMPETPHRWYGFGILFSLPLLEQLVSALLVRDKGLTYAERLAASETQDLTAHNKQRTYRTIAHAAGDFVLTPVAFLFFGAFLVVLLGDYWARHKTTYWVLADQPDTFLVAHYGDVALFKKVDLTTKKISNELVIQKIGDSAPLKLKEATLGELVPFKL